jgi:hypothetical protein
VGDGRHGDSCHKSIKRRCSRINEVVSVKESKTEKRKKLETIQNRKGDNGSQGVSSV